MLEDDSYIGGQENYGGFNGYNSMKRSDNYLDQSRQTSSPRNNLMRTYDSQTITQQFNYGFNYNTSGGVVEDQSQNSEVVNSEFAKIDNDTSHQFEQQQQNNSDVQLTENIIQEIKPQEIIVDISTD